MSLDMGLCDSCGNPSDDQEYVGHGMLFCQKCIHNKLDRLSEGFSFKAPQDTVNDEEICKTNEYSLTRKIALG